MLRYSIYCHFVQFLAIYNSRTKRDSQDALYTRVNTGREVTEWNANRARIFIATLVGFEK